MLTAPPPAAVGKGPAVSGATIAALIPVFNRARQVLEALASIAAQTRPPDSLTIVDDGSTDDTAAAVAAWLAGAKLPFPACLIRQEHAGVATATNRGVAEAGDAQFLAVLDSDDLWPPDHLQRLEAALTQRPDAVAASTDIMDLDLEDGRTEFRDARQWEGQCSQVIFQRGCPIPSATMVRIREFRGAGGCDTNLWCRVDLDLYLRLSLRGPWVHVPGAPISYRRRTQKVYGGAKDLTREIDGIEQKLVGIRTRERFIFRHGGRGKVPARVWRARLSADWTAMARAMEFLGRPKQTVHALAKAWWYRPGDMHAAVRLVKMWIRVTLRGGLPLSNVSHAAQPANVSQTSAASQSPQPPEPPEPPDTFKAP